MAAHDPPAHDADIRCLITRQQIEQAVRDLGSTISREYAGRPLTILGVLTGSIMLVTDLIRQIDQPLRVGLVQASSYRRQATTPGELRINTALVPDIADRDVLLVDDIFDTGQTMQGLLQSLQEFSPRSVRTAVLLWKRTRTTVDLVPDYFCFMIPDEFVVGYGLDYNDEYRHLPYIGVLPTRSQQRTQNRS
jgi:hypoxanthine phosphoribosyltransferase